MFVVSAEYDWFEGHESFYYELKSKSGANLINKYWFLGRGKNEVKLSIFSCSDMDSIVLLMMNDNYVITAYDLNDSYELDWEELKKLQPETL